MGSFATAFYFTSALVTVSLILFFLFLSLHTYIHTWGKELVYEKEKKGRRGMASKSDFWVTNCFQILTGAALICVNGINLHKSINCLFALPLFPRSYFFITTPLCKFANWPEKETIQITFLDSYFPIFLYSRVCLGFCSYEHRLKAKVNFLLIAGSEKNGRTKRGKRGFHLASYWVPVFPLGVQM